MRLGFHFDQTLTGAYHLLAAPTEERAIRLTLRVRAPSMRRFLLDKNAEVTGEIDMEGFADARAVAGTVLARLMEDQRERYALELVANDGKRYTFRGEKDFLLIAIVDTLTTLPASVYDEDGREIARALLRFDLQKDLGRTLQSFRVEGEF